MMECIILAGGFGTRISHIVSDVPKPMAPVNGRPFLSYLLDDLVQKGMTRIILAVGYMGQYVVDYYGDSYKTAEMRFSFEDAPLGTGGAIKKALGMCEEQNVYIVNGDTFFDVDFKKMDEEMQARKFMLLMAVKKLQNIVRYGTVETKDGRITAFREKTPIAEGWINGGVYLLKKTIAAQLPAGKFSFEQDYLEKEVHKTPMGVFENNGYFIDIGVPEDYNRACEEF
jgi:D-glycero-alpha-D-manno-heptose 1-phosphate guanylyltransferase